MPLHTGTRLGSYEIIASIGVGGMGEVYRAHDTTLDRHVALKILPAIFAADPDRVARFRREAKTLASLSHPNIAQIYGIEQSEGVSAIVMELVDGVTLEEFIKNGGNPAASRTEARQVPESGLSLDGTSKHAAGLSVEKALPIASQIAGALAVAHERGIIHRDLKPANIMISAHGVKILDFGLAKALDPSMASGSNAENSPTLTSPASQLGMIIGTAAYMSPEQARGRSVDRRADVWAFGVVLIEMLTGRRAFQGGDVTDILAAVIKDAAPFDALPPDTPTAVRRLLRRCVQKDPAERLDSMAVARMELADALSSAPEVTAAAITLHWWQRPLPLAAAIAALLTAVAILVAVTTRASPPPDLPRARLTFETSGPGQVLPVVAPDGRSVAWYQPLGGPSEKRMVWVRALDGTAARAVPGTTGAWDVFWSSDSQTIGFFADNKLKAVDLNGTGTRTVCETGRFAGDAIPAPGGEILFRGPEGILRVASSGGLPSQVVAIDRSKGEQLLWPLAVLPDRRRFLYAVVFNPEKLVVRIGDLHSTVTTAAEDLTNLLGRLGGGFAFVSGRVFFSRGNVVLAQALDDRSARPLGEPQPILTADEKILTISASPMGVLVWSTGSFEEIKSPLVWLDGSGKRLGDAAPADYYDFRSALSADALRAVVSITDPDTHTSDLWLLDLERGGRVRLTATPDLDEFFPTWSHDGTRIAFSAHRANGSAAIHDMPVSRAGEPRLIFESNNAKGLYVESWSADDRVLLLTSQTASRGADLVSLRVDDAQRPSDRRLVPYQQTRFGENMGRFSPDGRWVAFASDESGTDEVYVDTFPKPTEKHAISIGGGKSPNWSIDGQHLYYETDEKLMAVSIRTTPEFVASRPDVVFDLPKDGTNHCLPATAGRFLCGMTARAATSAAPAIISGMVNWMSGLKQ